MNKPQLTRADYRRLKSTQHYRVRSVEYFLALEKVNLHRNLGDGKLAQRKTKIQKLERELAAERRLQDKIKLLAK